MSEASTNDSGKEKAVFKPPIRREAPENLSRGLQAVEASRTERNRIKRPPVKVIIWFCMTLAVALILYFRWESTQIESARQKLLGKQREAAAHWGSQWFETRDAIEKWTMELAGRPEPDFVDKTELAGFDFREMPGIYLRLRKDQAREVSTLRQGALGSLRDGFTSCLLHTKGEPALAGKECKESGECEIGEMCGELGHCAKPGQPFNVRLAYRAFNVLSPEWEKEARETTNSLTLRGLDMAFDDAVRIDFPLAIDMLGKARFFLVVVDERPAPSAPPKGEEGASDKPTPEDIELASGATYPSRVALYRLSDQKLLFRITREPKAVLKGTGPITDTKIQASLNRQAQSCALADEVVTSAFGPR